MIRPYHILRKVTGGREGVMTGGGIYAQSGTFPLNTQGKNIDLQVVRQ